MHNPSLHKIHEMHKTKNNINTIRIKLTFKKVWISCSSSSICDKMIVSMLGLGVVVRLLLVGGVEDFAGSGLGQTTISIHET